MSPNPLDDHSNRPIKWVTIKSFNLDTRASFYAARLEAAGIPTFIANNLMGSIMPMADGGIKLQVPKEEFGAALEVLSEIKQRDEEKVEWDFREATHEDIAYEKELHTKSRRPYYLVITVLILAILFILMRIFSRALGIVPTWLDPF